MITGKNIFIWIIQILVAGLFLILGIQKLMSDPEVVAIFMRWGLPGNIYLIVGVIQVLGAIGLVIPRLAKLAAVWLMLIILLTLFMHITHNETGMLIFDLILILLLGVIVYFRNPLKKSENLVLEL